MGAPPPTATNKATRYELRAELARGGMGVVYRAYDRLAMQEVAYKRLLVEHKNAQARRAALFEQEYNVLARLSHPNIVQVYEYGFDAVAPYYTMELLSGTDLRERAPLPLAQACSVLRDVASALALIHARRLVHRDISPVNVRLTDQGRAKLLDFGALSKMGRASELVGTPAFVAPESLTSRMLDARTDLFSLGALAYWVLTRKNAFHARTMAERKANLHYQPVPPSAHRPELPRKFDELVLALLHPDPLARPASAAEVMERLTVLGELAPEPDRQRAASSYLAHPPLVGRAHELSAARAWLTCTMSRQRGPLCVIGPPGFGRTALLDQLAIEAEIAGVIVLRAQGRSGAAPFGVAQALLRGGLPGHSERPEAPHGMTPAFPQAGVAGQPATPVALAERYAHRVDRLMRGILALSREQLVVLLVDDAHLADAESLAVLASLAASPAATRISIALSLPEGVAEDALGALGKLVSGSRPVMLSALSSEDLLELVTSLFGPVPNVRRLALWLAEHACGSPALCMQQLRLLLHEGVIQYATGTFVLPHDVQMDLHVGDQSAAHLALLPHLSTNAQRLARVLALQNLGMDLEALSAVAELDGPATLEACDELRRLGVATIHDGRAHLSQQTVRSALADQLSPAVRRALHLKLARALEARTQDSATLFAVGEHFLRGGADKEGVRVFRNLLAKEDLDVLDSTLGPVLETALEAMYRRGHTDERCIPILVPLVRLGYFGSYALQRRYLGRALDMLARSTGLATARKLAPYCGAKPALYLGLTAAILRRMITPRSRRLGSLRESLSALLILTGSGAAAAASAFDPELLGSILAKLSPLGVFPKRSAPRVMYEFTQAIFAGCTGDTRASAEGFHRVLRQLNAGPVAGFAESARTVYRLGCLYGEAQSELSNGSPRALLLADQLQGAHPFYAPHAETTRMAYYAYRGDQERANHHRELAELAALRGGNSWSAVTIVTVRSLYAHVWTRDTMGLVRLIPELDRLAQLTPNLALYRDLARGYLALLRGDPREAARLVERVLADPRHVSLATHQLDRVYYAEVLRALGRAEEAKRICEDMLARGHCLQADQRRHLAHQQLALAEAELGATTAAAERLERCLSEAGESDNPLLVGSLHRDRALIALRAQDADAFRAHLRSMSEAYRCTNNPSLIRQTAQLVQQGIHANLLPRGERFDSDAGESEPPMSGTESFPPTEVETLLERTRGPRVLSPITTQH